MSKRELVKYVAFTYGRVWDQQLMSEKVPQTKERDGERARARERVEEKEEKKKDEDKEDEDEEDEEDDEDEEDEDEDEEENEKNEFDLPAKKRPRLIIIDEEEDENEKDLVIIREENNKEEEDEEEVVMPARKRRRLVISKWFEDRDAEDDFPMFPADYYRRIHSEVPDLAVVSIRNCFDQQGFNTRLSPQSSSSSSQLIKETSTERSSIHFNTCTSQHINRTLRHLLP